MSSDDFINQDFIILGTYSADKVNSAKGEPQSTNVTPALPAGVAAALDQENLQRIQRRQEAELGQTNTSNNDNF